MKKSILVLAGLGMLAFVSLVGCKEAAKETAEPMEEPTFDLAMAKQDIIAANNEWKFKFEAADSVGVANLYATDGKIMMNGAPAIVGRAQIQSTLHGLIGSGVTRIDLTTLDVWGTEDMVTEEGELALYAGDQQVDQGKYLVLWKNIEGKWHLFRDCFNSNIPPKD
jgi:ketosteroid isomerase-like protein